MNDIFKRQNARPIAEKIAQTGDVPKKGCPLTQKYSSEAEMMLDWARYKPEAYAITSVVIKRAWKIVMRDRKKFPPYGLEAFGSAKKPISDFSDLYYAMKDGLGIGFGRAIDELKKLPADDEFKRVIDRYNLLLTFAQSNRPIS